MQLLGRREQNTVHNRTENDSTAPMSQPLVPYLSETTHPPLRNPLLVAPPDSVPAVDELEATQAELAVLKKREHKAQQEKNAFCSRKRSEVSCVV